MPNNLDFSKVKDIKTIEVNPEGWISPLYVEYGILDDDQISGILSYCWRVKGTLHVFVIPVSRMDFLSSGNYKQHFTDVLETFRSDYISWKEQGFQYPWVQEYRDQFNRFIIV